MSTIKLYYILCLCGLLLVAEGFAIGSNQSIIFLHHSTGNNLFNAGDVDEWMDNYNLNHETNYQITERSYPNTPYPWENYPYDYWNLWVNRVCDEDNLNIQCLENISNNYDIVIFKHCYPGADILADIGNPDVSSARKSIENYKLQYRAIRELLDSLPDTKFVIWTLVPRHRLATTVANAQRSQDFVTWVKEDFLTEDGKEHPNIYIFDFWEYATEHNASPINGQVNTLKYDYEISHITDDSHPNIKASQEIGPIFSQFIVDVIEDKANYQQLIDKNSNHLVDTEELLDVVNSWRRDELSMMEVFSYLNKWKKRQRI